ncbi:hypothetical protein [Anaerolentibacter hominis]|uniref:hypothetical protein n=1 Tax=Anaerolentibacter hominis TaxID=3079009 RepID=UPI0031B8A75B
MENSLKGLLLAAGTIITCIVISLGFFIAREARDTASSGTGQISKLNAEFNESDKLIYDGMTVSGSEVVNAINKFKNEEIGVKVTTHKSTVHYIRTLGQDNQTISGKSSASVKDAQAVANEHYINPNARFLGEVLRDKNDTIIGLFFQQTS